MVRVFPYLVTRLSPKPFSELKNLDSNALFLIANEIINKKRELGELREQICQQLYRVVSSPLNGEMRNRLIEFKRDVFNARVVNPNYLLLPPVSSDSLLLGKVRFYIGLQESIENDIDEGNRASEIEMQVTREVLRKMSEWDSFTKGIVFATNSLSEQVKRYPVESKGRPTKDIRNAEISILKYITRICAKTSPFSTFTCVGIGRPVESSGARIDHIPMWALHEKPEKEFSRSRVLLNNRSFRVISQAILKNAAIRGRLTIGVNQTVRQQGNQYTFLANANNVESFQRIKVNKALQSILSILTEYGSNITFEELARRLQGMARATGRSIKSYLEKLIDLGFLELELGISGRDPDWISRCIKALEPFETEHRAVTHLLTFLRNVPALLTDFGGSTSEIRRKILDEMYIELKNSCLELEKAEGPSVLSAFHNSYMMAPTEQPLVAVTDNDEVSARLNDERSTLPRKSDLLLRPEDIVYEDSLLTFEIGIDDQSLRKSIRSLQHLLEYLPQSWSQMSERRKMFHFFNVMYGRNARVSLLRFYEDYYRELKTADESRKRQRNTPIRPMNDRKLVENRWNGMLEEIEKDCSASAGQWADSFNSIIEPEISGMSGVVQIGLRHLERASSLSKPSNSRLPRKPRGSSAVFAQFVKDESPNGTAVNLMLLNSGIVTGMGKLASRFLYMMGDEMTNRFKEFNIRVMKDDLFVEDCDASLFNANAHPPLLPYEVWLPGSQNLLPKENLISVVDLEVMADNTSGILRLVDVRRNKPVYIFDLGIQHPAGRSKLFQLLENFEYGERVALYPIKNVINTVVKKHQESENIDCLKLPRIVFDNSLILQRATWLLSKEALPIRNYQENEFQYFLRVNEWRSKYGVPEDVFVTVAWHNGEEGIDEKIAIHDDYKPQYISFRSLLLTGLFGKLVNKISGSMSIAEMLPRERELINIRGQKYVCEFLVHWYYD